MHHLRNAAFSLGLAAFTACSSSVPQGEEPPPPALENVKGYAVLRPGVAAAGQPDKEVLEALKSHGYKTIVNLRQASEDPSPIEEGGKLRELGLEYVHLPMSGTEFTVEQAAELGAVIDDPANHPVLVHCASGRRVHVLYALYRITQKGVPVDEAIAAGKPFGLQGPLEERVRALAAAQASEAGGAPTER
ncbi:MAG: protein tyrosine phosphatase family protein [Planctomycetes bacterium]|nr:protein tyrosine phosphatase family protein [Planctomycetota bacterium]